MVIRELFGVAEAPPLPPRYNIAPTQRVPAALRRAPDAEPELSLLRWGLIPRWARDPALGSRLINARAETAWEKPSFREAIRRRRCLLPADGFYEWQRTEAGRRPWLIRLRGARGLALGGLWERWRDPDTGETIESCTILTTRPNELVAPIHERMPVIVPRDAFRTWLDPTVGDRSALEPILRPYPAEEMEAYPVSRWVNDPSHDDPRCIEPAGG